MKKIVYYISTVCLLFTSGCSNWLEVNPQNKVEQGEMFSREDGFKNALTGIYILLKDQTLYGQKMTMEFTENLAQHWKTSSGQLDDYTNNYEYDNKLIETLIKDIYSKFYNAIANINNLLDYTGNGVLKGDMYDLIQGEAIALRAFCHLDILRLFGPVPGTQNEEKILSYVRTISKEYQQVHSWQEYTGLLVQDLNAAEDLLKKVDQQVNNDDFFKYRENRMNYWAVLALKARFYLWIQDKEKAEKYANLVISNKKFRLNQGRDFTEKDYVATPEHLFALHVFNLEKTVNQYIYQAGGVQQAENKIKTDIFESDITDYRVSNLWKTVTEEHNTRYVLMKYKQEDILAKSVQLIPLIRLYEMYLIAIECSDKVTVYKPLIDELVEARNISVVNVENVDKKNEFVAKEYQKEFYGEGQQFFQYKRRGDKTILWADKEGGSKVYVLPLPKSEIKFE